VIPEFYSRGANGVPAAWVARMRESMARLTPRFCTSRTLRDYTERHYLPAARRYLERSIDNGALGVRIVEWQRAVAQNWAAARFGELAVTTRGTQHLFELEVHLHELDPKTVQIELYADGFDGGSPERQIMKHVRQLEGVRGGHVYAGRAPAARPAAHYTPRMIGAYGDNVAVPLEAPWIDWQR
jgi:starch phosphorylase